MLGREPAKLTEASRASENVYFIGIQVFVIELLFFINFSGLIPLYIVILFMINSGSSKIRNSNLIRSSY